MTMTGTQPDEDAARAAPTPRETRTRGTTRRPHVDVRREADTEERRDVGGCPCCGRDSGDRDRIRRYAAFLSMIADRLAEP